MNVKTAPTLPEVPDWPAPDQRAEVWPRPLTPHQREAARYRAAKNHDKPWPKSYRREVESVNLTNGRAITVNLLTIRFGMLDRRPLTVVEHDRVHEAADRADPWRQIYSAGGYILGGVSPWPDVLVCNMCGRMGDDRNPYVLRDSAPEGYRSYLHRLADARADALAAVPGGDVVPFPGRRVGEGST